MKPEELRELLPLYALDALPEDERRAVEAFLERHPELWDELKALRETAADLSQGVSAPSPGPELKAKVMGRIAGAKPGFEPAPVRLSPKEAVKVRPQAPRWVVGIAAVFALLALGWGGYRAYPWLEWLQASKNPQAHVETLVDENQQPIGRAIFLPNGRTLVYAELPPPPPGKTYQLWGVNQTEHVGLDTFQGGLIVFQMPQGHPIVHITEERSGGSKTPTQLRAFTLEN